MQFGSKVVAVAAALALVFAGNVQAYYPNTGDRARDFAGYDMVSKQTVNLEQFIGKWVLVEFWASWCGPCMHELPAMLEITQPYRDQGRLQVLTVSSDSKETLSALKTAVKKLKIDFPVLYDGEQSWSPVNSDWAVKGIPESFLVNPQGVIVARGLSSDKLERTLRQFLAGTPALIGIRSSSLVNGDGSVSIYAEIMNTTREPTRLRMNLAWYDLITTDDEQGPIFQQREMGFVRDYSTATIQFAGESETTHEILVTPLAHWDGFSYAIFVDCTFAESEFEPIALGNGMMDVDFAKLEFIAGEWRVVRNISTTNSPVEH